MTESTRQLITAFTNEHGVPEQVYLAALSIIGMELGSEASQIFMRHVEAIDGQHYLGDRVNLQGLLHEMEPQKDLLLVGGIRVTINTVGTTTGSISSPLKEGCPFCGEPWCEHSCDDSKSTDEANTEPLHEAKQRVHCNYRVAGIESLTLACACAGIDVESEVFLQALSAAINGAG